MAIRDHPGSTSGALGSLLLRAVDEHGDGILVVSVDGRILYANRRFGELWDLDRALLDGGLDREAISTVLPRLRDPESFTARIEELYASPEAEGRDELLLADGRVFDRHAVPLRDDGGRVIGRAWFFEDVTEDRRRQEAARFLAEASALLAGSLEYERLAESLAHAAVPTIGDWCAVDIVGDDGEFHRIGAAHVAPDGAELLRELDRRYPLRPSEGRLRGRVVATGEPVVLARVDDAALAAVSRDAVHAGLLRRLGMTSAAWLPLAARGRLLGVLSFGVGAGRPPYGPEPIALAEELAGRASLALDNARTYRLLREREQQQAVVASLGQAAVGGARLDELFDLAVASLARTLRVEYAKVLELQPGGGWVRLVSGVGWRDGLVGEALVPTDADSQAGYTLTSGEPVIVEDLASETRFSGPALLTEHGVRSGMSVIIEGAEGHWGVLGIHTIRRRLFSPDDVNFLQAVANVLAEAIDRRRAEERLRDRDDRLELTLAASRTGTWEWDVTTGRLSWSDEISVLHGLPPGVAPADLEAYMDLIHPDDREPFRREVGRAVEEGTAYDLEFRILWPDGTVHWTNGVGRAFSDDSGRPVRMFGIGRDITDRKRAEEERDRLLEAERQATAMRDAFIGVLSHELRTPITTIYGGVKMLTSSRASLGEETRSGLLADVEAEADHLRRLVEDLLVLTRAERGRIELGDEPIQVLHLVRRVIAAEASRWPEIRFELRAGGPLPVARGDETSIEQVLRNLLSNAAKYSEPGSRIEVATDADEREVRIHVLDEGIGIAPDEVDQLFQLFYRSATTSKQVSGAGIGLFVTRRLVEAMGGEIAARARDDVPHGSEFGFTLPRYEPG